MSTDEDLDRFEALADERYISITTFRKDGSEASTPVWFVSDDLRRRLFVATGADTWKVRRIKRNAHVRVAPVHREREGHGRADRGSCTNRRRGATRAPSADREVRLAEVADREGLRAQHEATTKPTGESVYLEIVPRRHDEIALAA